MEINIIPGEKLTIKLWKTLTEKGIGGLLRPWQMRREGRAAIDLRCEEMVRLAQAERDAEAIRRGDYRLENRSGLKLIPANGFAAATGSLPASPPPNAQRLLEIAQNTNVADTIRREVNVAKAILHAEAELESDPQEPPAEKIDDDWLFRWRDNASQVSSEKLQSLWGKLLAGELRQPGSFSLRTLEFIKHLSQEDAKKIEKIAPFVISNEIIMRLDDDFLASQGISFSFLLEMQEIGILSSVDGFGLTAHYKSTRPDIFEHAIVSFSKTLIVKSDDANKALDIKLAQITTIGRQLISLGKFSTNEAYLRNAGEKIKSMGYHVFLADFMRVDSSRIKYYNAVEL